MQDLRRALRGAPDTSGPSYEDWTRAYPWQREQEPERRPADPRPQPPRRRNEPQYSDLLKSPSDLLRERSELLAPVARGGKVAELRAREPTMRERFAAMMMDAITGGRRPTARERQFVSDMMGSTGLGSTGIGLVDFSPLAPLLVSDELQNAVRAQNWLDALLAVLGLASVAGRGGRAIVGGARNLGHNPFKGKTPERIDAMLRSSGFSARGENPIGGKGNYVNPDTQRPYHIDAQHSPPKPPHVGVGRPRRFRNKGLSDSRDYPL